MEKSKPTKIKSIKIKLTLINLLCVPQVGKATLLLLASTHTYTGPQRLFNPSPNVSDPISQMILQHKGTKHNPR